MSAPFAQAAKKSVRATPGAPRRETGLAQPSINGLRLLLTANICVSHEFTVLSGYPLPSFGITSKTFTQCLCLPIIFLCLVYVSYVTITNIINYAINN